MAIRKRRIEAMVEALLAESNIVEAPVGVSRIAKAKGARIFVDALEGDLSGFLYRDKAQSVIGVNTRHSAARQNFTISHELGHLLLHDQEQLHVDHEFRVRLRNDVSSQGTDEAEQEANFFAASLLMPREFLKKDLENEEYVDLLDDDFLHGLARKYGVSTQALVNRLKNLGYIQE
ncbi:MAG: ImmA/IrrE family metallo-endopeptidase [Verrucomicrobiaceae bacterium]|nr:ImmA/IrrE family metallo-endopeptidase [Verrucomicrobiaceae bacterium]